LKDPALFILTDFQISPMRIKILFGEIFLSRFCFAQIDMVTATRYQIFITQGDTAFSAKHFESAAYYYRNEIVFVFNNN
jgi:hypothetical protein